MSNGVFTRDKRFKWVKGWLTGGTDPADGSVECGDGTAFPMLVTPDQLAEIMYRVRDTSVTGEVVFTTRFPEYGGDPEDPTWTGGYWRPDAITTHKVVGTQPDELATYSYFNDGYSAYNTYSSWAIRGYCANGVDVPPFADSLFGEAYSVVTHVSFVDGSVIATIDIREATSELALWIPLSGMPVAYENPDGFNWHYFAADYEDAKIVPLIWFGCGFNRQMSVSTAGGSVETVPYGFYAHTDEGYGSSGLFLGVSGKVAYVGTDNPTDPAAQIYIGLEFRTAWLWSRVDPAYGGMTDVCDLVFNLSGVGNSVSCPLYTPSSLISPPGDQVLAFTSATDFVFTATKWFPYAKLAAGVSTPVWDADTGAKL